MLYVTERPLAQLLDKYLGPDKDSVITLASGEKQKNLDNVVRVLQRLEARQTGKSALLVSFGGGVISDIAGFAAAIYNRGIGLVNIPTTLLAMVDASIGGKNGVDFKGVKNSVGTIYNPDYVFVDTTLLKTLPAEDMLSGVGELVKCAVCFDKELFELLQSPLQDNLETVVWVGIQDKLRLVKADPYENSSVRQLLNFGHSLGHALESTSDFRLKHGQAVAVGCNFAAFVSKEKGYISDEDYKKVQQLIIFVGLPLYVKFSVEEAMRHMKADKKKIDAEHLNFVLVKSIGQGVVEPLSFKEIERYLVEFKKAEA